MAATSRIDAVLTQLQATLSARPGLDGVRVFSAAVSTDDAGLESIQLNASFSGSDTVDAEQATAGMAASLFPVDETINVPGVIIIVRPGKGEVTIQAARARGVELLSEVELDWRDDPKLGGLFVRGYSVAAISMTQGFNDKGRICALDFTLRGTARLVTS